MQSGKHFKQRNERVRVKVGEAREQLAKDAAEHMVDRTDLSKQTIEAVENNGIVFIDEIDKICGGGGEIMCENLTYALKNAGQDVFVVSLYNERTPIARRIEEAALSSEHSGRSSWLRDTCAPPL